MIRLVVATLAPVVPLMLTMMSLEELLKKLPASCSEIRGLDKRQRRLDGSIPLFLIAAIAWSDERNAISFFDACNSVAEITFAACHGGRTLFHDFRGDRASDSESRQQRRLHEDDGAAVRGNRFRAKQRLSERINGRATERR